ncbi:hypothetical protein [Candidatus Venteria ishoeyi]|uniref:Uncharacterized protein n=1 Tax=Candidatus Venteria ishoeyi TaxID=1899563 RepID=A0A1H6FB52_9GAMM|nr:hypothetical protein [Candidatus Venteria ishoeyi]SEH07317.1 Uncharacterised protein [Candidatus Venteria ishoeyi]
MKIKTPWKTLKIIALTLAYSLLLPAHAEEAGQFNLFNKDRGKAPVPVIKPNKPKKPAKSPPKISKPKPPKKLPPQKDFSLRGINRIGSLYRIHLQAPDRKPLWVDWRKGNKKDIPGYAGYRILKVGKRRLQLAYPKGIPCQKDKPAQGVTCNVAKNYARMEILRGKPTAAPAAPKAPARISRNKNQARQANRTSNRGQSKQTPALAASFKKQIKPEDVPKGMKVVKTPFGDRLIPKPK